MRLLSPLGTLTAAAVAVCPPKLPAWPAASPYGCKSPAAGRDHRVSTIVGARIGPSDTTRPPAPPTPRSMSLLRSTHTSQRRKARERQRCNRHRRRHRSPHSPPRPAVAPARGSRSTKSPRASSSCARRTRIETLHQLPSSATRAAGPAHAPALYQRARPVVIRGIRQSHPCQSPSPLLG